jgi:periplasmic divalent cation tolerance protein
MPVQLVLCTCPDAAVADRIARTLVEEQLAACVNRLDGVRSVYRWQGQVERADEVLLLIKSTHERFAALCERVLALHPYELPELIAVDVSSGLQRYLDWVEASNRPA